MFHTLDKEELNLSIGPMALSVAEVGDFTRDYGTYIGDIKVISDKTMMVIVILFCPPGSFSSNPWSRLHCGQESPLHQKIQLRRWRLSRGLLLGEF